MMHKTIEAVYEDGMFRPVAPIKGLIRHHRVNITIETSLKGKHPLHELCGTLPDEDAVEMLKIVDEEFEKVGRAGCARQLSVGKAHPTINFKGQSNET